jgi:FkbM family methyltransferase
MTGQNTFPERVRRFYRGYRWGNIRVGHSLIRKALERLLKSEQEVCLRSGLKLRLDMTKGNQAGIFWEDGDAEVALTWSIRELVPLKGMFVDCGANCGLMGLLAAQYRGARVVFIEPHPRLAKTIAANIALNGFQPRAELVEAAASNAPGEVTFYENPVSDGSHSIHADWEGDKRVLGKVPCETLLDIIQCRKLPPIDFLKVDAEGNDYAVLQGAGDYLRPEFIKLAHVETTRDGEAICKLLAGRGYAGFAAIEKRGRELARMLKTYERGGRVSFFRPMGPDLKYTSNTLWVGKGSPVARFLEELDAGARAAGG